MTRFCTNCGKEIRDGMSFCTQCGAKAPEPVPQVTPQAAPEPVPQVTPQAAPQAARPKVKNTKSDTVSTGYFFGMMLLYSIPVIGWVVCIITAAASKNPNKKHFASAMLIWLIIGLVLAAVLFVVGHWVLEAVVSYFDHAGLSSGIFGGLN